MLYLNYNKNPKRGTYSNISGLEKGGPYADSESSERSTKTLIGSAVSGEGLVNVYRGTGKVLMSPVAPTRTLYAATNTVNVKAAAPGSNVGKL